MSAIRAFTMIIVLACTMITIHACTMIILHEFITIIIDSLKLDEIDSGESPRGRHPQSCKGVGPPISTLHPVTHHANPIIEINERMIQPNHKMSYCFCGDATQKKHKITFEPMLVKFAKMACMLAAPGQLPPPAPSVAYAIRAQAHAEIVNFGNGQRRISNRWGGAVACRARATTASEAAFAWL